jgi:hypothetical protein
MRYVIIVSKRSYGYVVCIKGNGRPFMDVLGSHHPEVAADRALAAWRNQRNDSHHVTLVLPPEVEAVIAARGQSPWN